MRKLKSRAQTSYGLGFATRKEDPKGLGKVAILMARPQDQALRRGFPKHEGTWPLLLLPLLVWETNVVYVARHSGSGQHFAMPGPRELFWAGIRKGPRLGIG